MKYFAILASSVALCGMFAGQAGWADTFSLPVQLTRFFLHTPQGYLGVSLVQARVPHAAEIYGVDHDAPASKSGLKVHDVILQLNGKTFDDVEQLSHRLHEIPAGRTISLLVVREDGTRQTVSVQLCDRRLLGMQAWSQHYTVPPPPASHLPAGMSSSFINRPPRGAGFLDSVIPKGSNMGADLNPVRTQLAGYFGVSSGTGLLVENVDRDSPSDLAGLKAGDVVTKVESQPMTSRSDWTKAMRSHHTQAMQITVMRNKQPLVLTMNEGKPKKN